MLRVQVEILACLCSLIVRVWTEWQLRAWVQTEVIFCHQAPRSLSKDHYNMQLRRKCASIAFALFNFLSRNFSLVDTLFFLTELRICYPIKQQHCLSSIFYFYFSSKGVCFNLTYTIRFFSFCALSFLYKNTHTHTSRDGRRLLLHNSTTLIVHKQPQTQAAFQMPLFSNFTPRGATKVE